MTQYFLVIISPIMRYRQAESTTTLHLYSPVVLNLRSAAGRRLCPLVGENHAYASRETKGPSGAIFQQALQQRIEFCSLALIRTDPDRPLTENHCSVVSWLAAARAEPKPPWRGGCFFRCRIADAANLCSRAGQPSGFAKRVQPRRSQLAARPPTTRLISALKSSNLAGFVKMPRQADATSSGSSMHPCPV